MNITLPKNIEQTISNALEKTFDQSAKGFHDIVLAEANAISQNMASRVPVNLGALKASIGVNKSKKNPLFVWVGPQYSNKSSLSEGGNHAHLVEFGSKARYMKRGLIAGEFTRESGGSKKFEGLPRHAPYAGKFTGVMPATPFVRPTFDSMGTTSISNLKAKVLTEVGRQAQKQGL